MNRLSENAENKIKAEFLSYIGRIIKLDTKNVRPFIIEKMADYLMIEGDEKLQKRLVAYYRKLCGEVE